MNIFRKRRKLFAIISLVVFLSNILHPLQIFAITGNNNMPEYRSFEPVATTNMVNAFDGSFTYNIPILDVPNGYPLSLSYHSNEINTDAQSSWVGLGWTLNPGAINRIKRGFPDDWNGENVTYYNKMPDNWTVSAKVGVGDLQILGYDGLLSLDLSGSITYNNYKGFGTSVSLGFSAAGIVNMDFSMANGRFGFTPEINPGAIFDLARKIDGYTEDRKYRKNWDKQISECKDEQSKKAATDKKREQDHERKEHRDKEKATGTPPVSFGMSGGALSLNSNPKNFFSISPVSPRAFPTSVSQYMGITFNLKLALGINILPFPLSGQGYLDGSYARQRYNLTDTKPVYGYMFSEVALNPPSGIDPKNTIMDYSVENDSPFEKRDNILGIPVPNNDIYNISGESTGGSFRPYRSEFGFYRKNATKSEDFSAMISADVNLPVGSLPPIFCVDAEPTLGVDLGGTYHSLDISDWDAADKPAGYLFHDKSDYTNSNENWFFRFTNDLGGNFDLTNSNAIDNVFCADINNLNYNGWSSSVTGDGFSSADGHPYGINPEPRSSHHSRSSYMDYNTIGDVSNSISSYKYKSYEKNLQIVNGSSIASNYLNPTYYTYAGNSSYYLMGNDKKIQELANTNADGVQYVYGLPAYTQNEKQLSYSLNCNSTEYDEGLLNGTSTDPEGILSGGGHYTKIIGDANSIEIGAERKSGYSANASYATTYLLTQINSPDYIDRTMNGPTKDDFGSYTKITYSCFAGASVSGGWYKYRNPYEGVYFNKGSLSDNKDDMGSFNYGEKELYYIYSIASKTHVAIFTVTERRDGYGVTHNDIKGGGVGVKLQKLDKIDLYAIDDVGEVTAGSGVYIPNAGAKPIKTVHFEYDYSLCPGLPNFDKSGGYTGTDGKLTLTKVWFEYEGKITSKLSPYQFEYNYNYYNNATGITNSSDAINYPAPYGNLTNDYKGMCGINTSKQKIQNPPYSYVNTDRWGNYRDYGLLKNGNGTSSSGFGDLARYFNFVQQNITPNVDFDPAAWCLKRIILPSGGEIHVQYEQNDYMYVQDKRAAVMVPLLASTSSDETAGGSDDKRYYLDLEKIGITNFSSMSNFDKQNIVDDIFQKMNLDKERMYFNFYYQLLDANSPEYLEGYARIDAYGYDNGGVYFKFNGNDPNPGVANTLYRKIAYPNATSKRELPRKVCSDFYRNNRRGNITTCAADLSAQPAENKSVEGYIKNIFKGLEQVVDAANSCNYFQPAMSYVRVQMPLYRDGGIGKKYGGGCRVKRILMYDPGIDSDKPSGTGAETDHGSLYGQEYNYTTPESGYTISSGVATFEPSEGRRENPFVVVIDKDPQTGFNALLYGRDVYSQEGPIGESLYPSPSVGYSKVTIKNINTNTFTSTGYEIHDFYTCRDYPFKAVKSDLQQIHPPKISLSAGANIDMVGISVSFSYEKYDLSQGYMFISNSMHGKQKQITKYASNGTIMAQETYEYFSPSDMVDVMDENMSIAPISCSYFGKECEILGERRKVNELTIGGDIGVDVTLGAFVLCPIPFPIPGSIPVLTGVKVGVNGDIKNLRTHVINKIISYPAILKKTTSLSDGVTHVTENKVLDKFSGTPVVTNTYDDFGNIYINQDFLASCSHENFRSKALNQKLQFADIPFAAPATGNPYLTFAVDNTHLSQDCKPAPSDALKSFVKGDFLELKGTNTALYHVYDIDYINGLVYLQRSGISSNYTGSTANVTILRSGYNNMLTAKQGNIMYHGKNISPFSSNGNYATPIIQTINNQINTDKGILVAYPETTLTRTFTIPKELCCEYNEDVILTYIIQLNPSYPNIPYPYAFSYGYSTNNSLCGGITVGTFAMSCFYAKTEIYNNNTCLVIHGVETSEGAPYECRLPLCLPDIPVVSATTTTYYDTWNYNQALYPTPGFPGNDFEKGTLGKWRPFQQFVYRERLNTFAVPNPTSGGTTPNDYKNFNSGKFKLKLVDLDGLGHYGVFDWKDAVYQATYQGQEADRTPVVNHDNWVNVSTTTQYSPNGNAVEDKDVMNIYSAAKYGYYSTVPVAIAQNAKEGTISYESFENLYNGTVFENNLSYITTITNSTQDSYRSLVYAHTGLYSLLLNKSNYGFPVGTIKNTYSTSKDFIVRAWLYNPNKKGLPLENSVYFNIVGIDKNNNNFATTNTKMQKICDAGLWSLYESVIAGVSDGTVLTVSVTIKDISGVYIDDVKIQPSESEMTCYVYDKAKRPVAILDDQHFASIFQYNMQGLLVRKIKETVKGQKTVSETQYNTKK
ncbi:MAG: hypothetical protein WC223_08975 [Bacteroidales bacterium]|jgi:hypothetical protein